MGVEVESLTGPHLQSAKPTNWESKQDDVARIMTAYELMMADALVHLDPSHVGWHHDSTQRALSHVLADAGITIHSMHFAGCIAGVTETDRLPLHHVVLSARSEAV